MRTIFLTSALLVGVLTVGGPRAWAQGQGRDGKGFRLSSADLAITYTTERATVTPNNNNPFWLRGGSADAAFTFFHGLGAVLNFTGEHASNIAPAVNLGKIAFMAGPRYTVRAGSKHENRVFIESLFGGVHAFDSVFPLSTGVASSANSFSLQVGGGYDVDISKGFAIRVFEADYVRTSLPNGGNDVQNHLHLAFGVSYHIQRH